MKEYYSVVSVIMFFAWMFCTMRFTDYVLTDTAMVTVNEKNWMTVQRCLDKWYNVFVSKKDKSISCDVTLIR